MGTKICEIGMPTHRSLRTGGFICIEGPSRWFWNLREGWLRALVTRQHRLWDCWSAAEYSQITSIRNPLELEIWANNQIAIQTGGKSIKSTFHSEIPFHSVSCPLSILYTHSVNDKCMATIDNTIHRYVDSLISPASSDTSHLHCAISKAAACQPVWSGLCCVERLNLYIDTVLYRHTAYSKSEKCFSTSFHALRIMKTGRQSN